LKVATALLLIAHGSRRAEANAELRHVADAVVSAGRYALVEVSYLELTGPTIAEGGERCVERGAKRVILLPYFLSPGVHVRDDLTEARAALAARFPAVDFRLAEPLGGHPLLLDILAERAAACEASG
jgi:sirohydrochlorin ferrochelatase